MPLSDAELALIAAIHADPKNDAPRLAYADWLEGNGQGEFAEFIRLMCRKPYLKLAMSRTQPWTAKVDLDTWEMEYSEPERVRRAIDLLGRIYGSERLPKCDFYEYFYRGLPLCEISTERYPSLLDRGELDALPLTRFAVFLYTASLAKWVNHPLMLRADELRYYPAFDCELEEARCITSEDLQALAASPLIDRLDKLGLCGRFTPEASAFTRNLRQRVAIDYNY